MIGNADEICTIVESNECVFTRAVNARLKKDWKISSIDIGSVTFACVMYKEKEVDIWQEE